MAFLQIPASRLRPHKRVLEHGLKGTTPDGLCCAVVLTVRQRAAIAANACHSLAFSLGPVLQWLPPVLPPEPPVPPAGHAIGEGTDIREPNKYSQQLQILFTCA